MSGVESAEIEDLYIKLNADLRSMRVIPIANRLLFAREMIGKYKPTRSEWKKDVPRTIGETITKLVKDYDCRLKLQTTTEGFRSGGIDVNLLSGENIEFRGSNMVEPSLVPQPVIKSVIEFDIGRNRKLPVVNLEELYFKNVYAITVPDLAHYFQENTLGFLIMQGEIQLYEPDEDY